MPWKELPLSFKIRVLEVEYKQVERDIKIRQYTIDRGRIAFRPRLRFFIFSGSLEKMIYVCKYILQLFSVKSRAFPRKYKKRNLARNAIRPRSIVPIHFEVHKRSIHVIVIVYCWKFSHLKGCWVSSFQFPIVTVAVFIDGRTYLGLLRRLIKLQRPAQTLLLWTHGPFKKKIFCVLEIYRSLRYTNVKFGWVSLGK
jgi:hypothetical protein